MSFKEFHGVCETCPVSELMVFRYDFRKKRVGVIGNGSSSIQFVPKLQPLEGVQMTVFMRSPTWISGTFGHAAMTALGLDPNDVECEFCSDCSDSSQSMRADAIYDSLT